MPCINLLNSRGGTRSLDFVITTYSYPLLTLTYQTFALVLTPIVAWFAEIFILGIMRGLGEMGGPGWAL